MKKFLLSFSLSIFLLSCNSGDDKTAATTSNADSTSKSTSTVDLPYKASYSSSFTADVSDADLKTVMMSYKLGDSIRVEMSSGQVFEGKNADLMKVWGKYRDSLSSVRIKMDAWHKMYATDHKEGYIVTWYDEFDTYKNGKVDSASYHDINRIKNGKITYYSQYKRPKK